MRSISLYSFYIIDPVTSGINDCPHRHGRHPVKKLRAWIVEKNSCII
jgi:hypothetical protein